MDTGVSTSLGKKEGRADDGDGPDCARKAEEAVSTCLCQACCAKPSPTYTEKFRHECEVRYVASLAHKSARKVYLSKVAIARGRDVVQRIIDGLRKMQRREAQILRSV